MEQTLPKEDLELHEAFGVILSIESFSDYISEIIELIYNSNLSKESIEKIFQKYDIDKIEDIKEELLDVLILYINLALNDHIVSDNEKQNIKLLKSYFKIEEGDFYNDRYEEVEEILHRQFGRMYSDNTIDQKEALHNVGLQEIFDLSYDQFDEFKKPEVLDALERGANISELDTATNPIASNLHDSERNRKIPQDVQDLVWNRDGGKCSECGINEKLEFDHIIPFSKGGSNTYRNIQLLCETHNRKKSNKIG